MEGIISLPTQIATRHLDRAIHRLPHSAPYRPDLEEMGAELRGKGAGLRPSSLHEELLQFIIDEWAQIPKEVCRIFSDDIIHSDIIVSLLSRPLHRPRVLVSSSRKRLVSWETMPTRRRVWRLLTKWGVWRNRFVGSEEGFQI